MAAMTLRIAWYARPASFRRAGAFAIQAWRAAGEGARQLHQRRRPALPLVAALCEELGFDLLSFRG
jgi:hypothetical protein